MLETETERRALLGSFGLIGKAAGKPAGTLSGGERAKLGLAMLAAGEANLLLLDEPTNNLDPPSVLAVGKMLSAWPGTLVVVSHDRAFVEALRPTHALRLPDERATYGAPSTWTRSSCADHLRPENRRSPPSGPSGPGVLVGSRPTGGR